MKYDRTQNDEELDFEMRQQQAIITSDYMMRRQIERQLWNAPEKNCYGCMSFMNTNCSLLNPEKNYSCDKTLLSIEPESNGDFKITRRGE